jgi:protein-S-isoprenylcysteine O-methyltransferase Ste14
MSSNDTATAGARDNSGVRTPPPLIFFGFIILGFVIEFFLPLRIITPAHAIDARMIGVILLIAAVALFASAVGTFRTAGTSVIPMKPTTALTFLGPYRFTRNPIYLAMAVATAGIALIANAVWPLLMVPFLMVALTYTAILREERYLAMKFGEPYTTYTSRVRRWI